MSAMLAVPEVGEEKFMSISSTTDLPLEDAPTSAKKSPLFTARLVELSNNLPFELFVTSVKFITATFILPCKTGRAESKPRFAPFFST